MRLKRKKIKLDQKMIKKSALKILIVLILIGLNWTWLLAVGRTFAYFNDTEDSDANTYQAGILDFSLRSGQSNFAPTETALNMKPGDTVSRDVYIKKEGSLPFKYTAVSEPVAGSCDLELYEALQLKVWYNYYTATPTAPNYHEFRTMVPKYDGLLKDFDLRSLNPDDPDLQIPNSHNYFDNLFYGSDEHWFYASEIILPSEISAELQNKSCDFKFVFDAWQTDFTMNSGGFTDTESITSTISTGNWMPDVTVMYPDGGEVWYLIPNNWPQNPSQSALCESLGMNSQCQYPIDWVATNKIGPDIDLLIDIYYSVDSGASWMSPPITLGTSNDGRYWWKPPFDTSYITENGRVKVVATHKDYSFLTDFDISDNDFCPPMISNEAEAMALLASLNNVVPSTESTSSPEIFENENIIEGSLFENNFVEELITETTTTEEITDIETTTAEEIIGEATANQETTSTDEIIVTEIITKTSGQTTENVVENVNEEELPENVEENTIEEIIEEEIIEETIEETTTEEIIEEETVVNEEAEEPQIEPEPIVEEIPILPEPEIIIVEDNSENNDSPENNNTQENE